MMLISLLIDIYFADFFSMVKHHRATLGATSFEIIHFAAATEPSIETRMPTSLLYADYPDFLAAHATIR